MFGVFMFVVLIMFYQHGCMVPAHNMRYNNIVSSLRIQKLSVIQVTSAHNKNSIIIKFFAVVVDQNICIDIMDGRNYHLGRREWQFFKGLSIGYIGIPIRYAFFLQSANNVGIVVNDQERLFLLLKHGYNSRCCPVISKNNHIIHLMMLVESVFGKFIFAFKNTKIVSDFFVYLISIQKIITRSGNCYQSNDGDQRDNIYIGNVSDRKSQSHQNK